MDQVHQEDVYQEDLQGQEEEVDLQAEEDYQAEDYQAEDHPAEDHLEEVDCQEEDNTWTVVNLWAKNHRSSQETEPKLRNFLPNGTSSSVLTSTTQQCKIPTNNA